MNFENILVISGITILLVWITPARWHKWVILVSSVLALFWLQPSTPIRNLDFWFPLASISIVVLVWAMTRVPNEDGSRANLITAGVIIGIVLLISLTRYAGPVCCITPARPPQMRYVLIAIVGIGFLLLFVFRYFSGNRYALAVALLMLILVFIILKTDPFAKFASEAIRTLTKQNTNLASPFDLRWLGFSYLAFRLIHTLRDRQHGKLPSLTLKEYISYTLFYPSITAGPIDRVQRFVKDYRQPVGSRKSNTLQGGQRVLLGIFKKFVIADALALIALSPQNASQSISTPWLWVLLYAYALRIYFDFAGYTDIAIGLGNFYGIALPENFAKPYLKSNITSFWNSWHITLAQWFRAYFFNPLTRSMHKSKMNYPSWLTILIGQLSTMLLIGLWHGISWNFAIWGLWHGIGLFAHNRWLSWTRQRISPLDQKPIISTGSKIGGWFITFNYVTLGWVWFALPSPEMAVSIFRQLFSS